MRTIFSHDKLLVKQQPSSRNGKKSAKTACGCPCSGIIIIIMIIIIIIIIIMMIIIIIIIIIIIKATPTILSNTTTNKSLTHEPLKEEEKSHPQSFHPMESITQLSMKI